MVANSWFNWQGISHRDTVRAVNKKKKANISDCCGIECFQIYTEKEHSENTEANIKAHSNFINILLVLRLR